jgi:hypothetical protein
VGHRNISIIKNKSCIGLDRSRNIVTNSFIFTTSATTSTSNLEKRATSKKLHSKDSKDLLKKGQKQK